MAGYFVISSVRVLPSTSGAASYVRPNTTIIDCDVYWPSNLCASHIAMDGHPTYFQEADKST